MFEKLRDIISDKLSVDAENITLDTSFKDDLDADSIALFEIVMAIEDEFSIEVQDESFEKIHTVGDVLAVLEKLVEM